MVNCVIRQAEAGDAEAFVALQQHLAQDNNFMLQTTLEAQTTTVEKQAAMFDNMGQTQHPAKVYVAFQDDTLVGFIACMRGNLARMKHVASRIAIGVHHDYRRQGIARQLFQHLEDQCKAQAMTRIEFSVMVHNDAALTLYLDLGYEIEGRRVQAVCIDGEYIDEYYIGKILTK